MADLAPRSHLQQQRNGVQQPQNERKRAREDPTVGYYEADGDIIEEEGYAEEEGEEWGQLPTVDDLEVAALAAEAAMEAIDIRGEAGRTRQTDSSSEESSSDEESSSSEESSSEDEDMPQASLERVTVSLEVTGDEGVRLELAVVDDDMDSLDGSDIVDPEVLKEMLERMNDDGDDARAAAKEAAEMEASLPQVEPLDVEIRADDRLQAAGTITAVLANQIIIQAPKEARAVDEGSVLCLAGRQGLGRVEEVFGPVDEPLYTLRYAGGGEMPSEVAAGAEVFSVEKYSSYVLPEAVKAAPGEDGVEEEGMEFEFSDDDAEAVFQRLHSGAASGLRPRMPGGPAERTFQPASRERGRSGANPRPARGAFRGREAATGGRGGGRAGSHPADPSSRGFAAGRRGRGRQGPPGPHVGGARGRGAAPLIAGRGAPPPGGQWVWVPQDAPQQGPQPGYPPQQYPTQQPRPSFPSQQLPPQQYPPQLQPGYAQAGPAAYAPRQPLQGGFVGPQGDLGDYGQQFGETQANFGAQFGEGPMGRGQGGVRPPLQSGPVRPVWNGSGGPQQQWPRGGGNMGSFYPNGLP